MDETTSLTSWFSSSDDSTQSFNGVELSKINDSLSVSYRTGTDVVVVVKTQQFRTTCKNDTS